MTGKSDHFPCGPWILRWTIFIEILRLMMGAAHVERVPFIWYWPDGAPNCLIMTHDVETSAGRDFTPQLMDIDESYGFKASFQVVPERRYEVPDEYVERIRSRGFEFNIHDLNHDGCLYRSERNFSVGRRKSTITSVSMELRAFVPARCIAGSTGTMSSSFPMICH